MKQTKQFLRPLLMAIVMLVGMLVPQGAWAQVTLYSAWGDEFWYESMAQALHELEDEPWKFGDGPVIIHFDQDNVISEELDCSRLGRDITIDLNGCVLTNEPEAAFDMSCIVAFKQEQEQECDYRITIQDGMIESHELDAIYIHCINPDPNYQLVLQNVKVVTHSEGRHCLFDAMPEDWEDWGYDGHPERAPLLQIINSEFHSNGCSAISFTLQRNNQFVKSILPDRNSFYNAKTDVELKECADRPFVDENGNPATDIRTGYSPDLPKMKFNDSEDYYGTFKQAMDCNEGEFTLTLLDDVKEGLYTTNRFKSVTIDLNGHTLDITLLYADGAYLNIIDSSEGKTGKLIVERFDVETPAENNAVIEGNVITWGDDCFTNNGLVEYVDGDFINNGDFITSWTWADDHSSATLRINHEDVDAVVTNEDTTPATCIASGVRTYTAAATYRDRNYADTKDEEIAIDPNAHDFTSKTLTAEPDADGLYAYACDRGCGAHTDDHIVKASEGESTTTIALTANTDGETTTYTASAPVTVPDGAFSTPVDFTATGDQVTIDRTFTAATPATINLPFDVDASKMSETYYTFGGIEQNSEGKWVATMNPVTGTLIANTPYIVLPSGTSISITDNTATVLFKADASANSSTTSGDWTMKAAKTPKTWAEGDQDLGKAYGFAAKAQAEGNITAGQFVKVGAEASIAAGRAYLQYNGEGTPTRAGELELPSTIVVRFVVGSTTGIGTIDTESGEFTFDGWYDLNGRRVSEPTKGGIYFNKNKKIIVK